MSDRLISADKLIEFYKECGEYSIPANVIIQNIKDAPIACNIEVMCKQIEMIVDRSGYNVDSENNITDEYISQNAVLNIVRHGGVVMQKKETPTEHTCENCDNRESCDYYHYSGKDWKEYIGTECDEWKGGAE